MNKPTMRSWLSVLTALVWVACVLPPAWSAGNPMLPTRLEQFRLAALDLEKEGQWLNACILYEKILKEDRSLAEAHEGYQRCLRHLQQTRRLRDRNFQDILANLKPYQALDVYAEVLAKLQANYVDRDRAAVADLFRHGLDELRFALEDEAFLRKHLLGVSPEAIRAFRDGLEDWRSRDIRDREDARAQVQAVAQAAQDSLLRLDPIVVVIEFACGACNALDEYTFYLTPAQLRDVQAALKGQFVGVGVDLAVIDQQLVVAQVYPNSPAADRLRPNDRIRSIDHRSVDEQPLEVVAGRLRGEAGSIVEMEVISAGDMVPHIVKLVRQPVNVPSVVDVKLEEGIGYLRLIAFQETTVQEMKDTILQLQMEGMKVLVLDLRGNSGGLFKAGAQVAELFIGDGVVARTKSRLKEHNTVYRANNPNPLMFPLVVLVDGDTASSAELLAGALKEHKRATLVGQTTFGKNLLQTVVALDSMPAGVRVTIAKFSFPYNGQGVIPHIPVLAEPSATMDLQKNAAWQEAKQLAMMVR